MSELKNDTSLPMSETAQQAFVGYVIKSEEFLVQVKNRIKSDWFISSKNAALYDLYTQFHTEFGYSAKKEEFFCWDVVACKDFSKVTELKQAWIAAEVQTGEFQKKFIADQLTKWLQTKIWHEASLRSADFFNAGKLSEAQAVMQNAIKEYEQANFNGEPPLNFASPLDLVAAQEVEHAAGLTTGLTILDKKLNPDCKDGGLLRGDTTVILAPVNVGKCLGIDTPVIMANGKIKKIQDIRKGEQVMGPDGLPRNVLSTTKGIGPLYEIIPNGGGDSWVCNDAHVLSLKPRQNEGHVYKEGQITNIPVSEYLRKSKNFKKIMALWRAKLDFGSKDQIMDPYLFGLWLGDGHSDRAALTTADEQLAVVWQTWLKYNGDDVSVYQEERNRASTYAPVCPPGVDRVVSNKILRDMGVLSNKHIPDNYLFGSTEQRLRLLAGLTDSDGYVDRCNVEISQKNIRLGEQIAYLARSLGFKTKTSLGQKKDQNGTEGTYLRIVFSGDCTSIPVKLDRKMGAKYKKKVDISGFKVRPLGIGDYYGFTLDGDHLFLLGDFTVTHNTTTLITMARHNVARANDVLFISHEGRPRDIMEKMFCSMTKLTRSTFRAATKDPNHEFHQNVLACARALDKKLTYISMNKPGLTVEEVISTVSAQQSKKKLAAGKGFDMVIIDYPGILKSSVTRKGQEHRHEQDYVYRQFVQLALDENVHMVLAAQTNRAASRQNKENGSYKSKKNNENKLLGNEDIAEAFGIAQAATNLITVNRDPVSMQKGYMTLYIAKSRSSETDWAIACKTAFDRALAFSNELGATAYRGSGPMSDKIDSMVTQFNGSEIDTNSLIGMVG